MRRVSAHSFYVIQRYTERSQAGSLVFNGLFSPTVHPFYLTYLPTRGYTVLCAPDEASSRCHNRSVKSLEEPLGSSSGHLPHSR